MPEPGRLIDEDDFMGCQETWLLEGNVEENNGRYDKKGVIGRSIIGIAEDKKSGEVYFNEDC